MCGVVGPLGYFSIIFQYSMQGDSGFVFPNESMEDSWHWGQVVKFLESVIDFLLWLGSQYIVTIIQKSLVLGFGSSRDLK